MIFFKRPLTRPRRGSQAPSTGPRKRPRMVQGTPKKGLRGSGAPSTAPEGPLTAPEGLPERL
eukprot:1859424-Pyramimonas_sp.AAC.1